MLVCGGSSHDVKGGETYYWFYTALQIKAYARKEVMYFLLHTVSQAFFFLLTRMSGVCHEWKQHLTCKLFIP